MKYLFLFLVTMNVHAVTIGQFISTPEGSSLQTFDLNKTSASYDKKSNFFDKRKDLSLGKFEIKGEDFSADLKYLKSTLDKIKAVDELLQKKNSSFNDLSRNKPHDSFITLEDYRISQDSDLYPGLKQIFEKMIVKSWKPDTGIKVSDDLTSIITYKKGKEASKEAFNMAFHCQKDSAPTICSFKDLGIIYIK